MVFKSFMRNLNVYSTLFDHNGTNSADNQEEPLVCQSVNNRKLKLK